MKAEAKKKIAILGSTGSIGKSAVELIRQSGEYDVELLMVNGTNIPIVIDQCKQLKPRYLLVSDLDSKQKIMMEISDSNILILSSSELENIIHDLDLDVTISAIYGFAGTIPTILMSRCSKRLSIANKEAIIYGWNFIKKSAQSHGCEIIPIDSEHNAIFQLLCKQDPRNIKNITITASGGPFFKHNSDFAYITPEMALQHPIWSMGVKNTIDSATLVNKGIEIMEACLLFDMKEQMIKTVIHPQSIVHGMITWKTNASFCFMSNPDMKIHIANAIFNERHQEVSKEINLVTCRNLEFYEIDDSKFPSVQLARDAYNKSSAHIVAYNTANEVAVKFFMNKKITFLNIFKIIAEVVSNTETLAFNNIDDLLLFHEEIKRISIETAEQKSIA